MHAATSIPGTRTRRKRGRRCNQNLCSLLKEAARRRPRRAEKQGRESKSIYNMPKSENQNGCNSFCTRFSFVNSGYLAARNLQNHRKIHRKRHISDELWITENPVLRFEEPGHGASGDTAFFKKHSNINGFRTPEQRNYLYSALLKPSISAAIARFISR